MNNFVLSAGELQQHKKKRGPRYFVYCDMGRGQYAYGFADTPDEAERKREGFRRDFGRGRNVRIVAPEDQKDLVQSVSRLARKREEADKEAQEAMDKLRAAGKRLLEQGWPETWVANSARVDRDTVRGWNGKKRPR